MYPTISEYIEAIKSAEDNFKELTNLRPVLGDDGQPVITSGNFAVVFKMQDIETSKFYALKCFIKDQEGREEAYHQITEELKNVDSPYLVSIRYLEKELSVNSMQTVETEFPVLLMDWVEGKTLDLYISDNINDKFALGMLSCSFNRFASWLISMPFAHGDLTPENIIIRNDRSIVIVDYDGMYVPSMSGQKAREIGSPDFRHPERNENDFNGTIDHFSIISILLSLYVIHKEPNYYLKYGAKGRLLFSASDYLYINNSIVFSNIPDIIKDDINYKILLEMACNSKYFNLHKYISNKPILLKKGLSNTGSKSPLIKNIDKTNNSIVNFEEVGKLLNQPLYNVDLESLKKYIDNIRDL